MQVCTITVYYVCFYVCIMRVCVLFIYLQVGCFDPYSDDPRLGIQKICLCKYSGKLVVAGTAGQVELLLLLIYL